MFTVFSKCLILLVAFSLSWAGHAGAGESGAASKQLQLASLDQSEIHLGAVKAAVADLETGKLLYEKHADWVTPIASITKLMTAMVVMDSGQSLTEWVEIPEPDRETRKNAYSRIRIGSTLKRGDLLRLALMSSENLAAYTLAHSYPGGVDAFVAQMNVKAQELGMLDSHFADPSGLSSQNKSTADDLVKMVSAAFSYNEIREYSTTPNYTARFRKPRYVLGYGNTNLLVHRDSWDIGLSKTGYITEAGRCLVLVSNFQGREVAMVFLDAFGKRTPQGDAGRVKRWLTTGKGGSIAGAALRYEQEKSQEYPYRENKISMAH